MMTTHPRLRSTTALLLTLLLFILNGIQETHATANDVWWDDGWRYRILLGTTETGTVLNTLNFSEILKNMELEDALVDLRSLRVVPYVNGVPGEPVPFEETFSQLIIDADQIVIDTPPDYLYWQILEESTSINIDHAIKTQGDGSLHAHIEISEYSNLDTGFYFFFNDSFLSNWSNYEVLLYDIYPEIDDDAANEIPSTYLFKLEGLSNCPVTYIDGPELAQDKWNGVDLPLQPFGMCENPGYSSIDMMKFVFQRESNTYLEIGDILDLWVDNFRMFDQDADGQIIWNAEENVDNYYLYFNLLRHGEAPIFLPLVCR